MSSTYSDPGVGGSSKVVAIEVLGVSFSIRSDDDPDYIHGLVSELKNRLSHVSSQMKIVDPLKLAIVTNLLTLDEMRRFSSGKTDAGKEFEASSLLDTLDRRLGELGL
jgi:cell division protein ZapA (FtsZ GTPase activity inhibitor)